MADEVLEIGELQLAKAKCGILVGNELLEYFKEKYGLSVEVLVNVEERGSTALLKYVVRRKREEK